MIKQTVSYFDIENGEEVERESLIRFVFTLPALRLYEQKTGRIFFEDYQAAFKRFGEALKSLNLENANDINPEEMTLDDQLALMPILADPVINGFLLDFIPCLYAEIENGIFIQNDETRFNAENSMWMMGLVNLTFFIEVFQEITANEKNAPVKNVKRAVKKN